MFLVRNNKGARPKGTFSAYFITEEVRLPFRREKSYAKVYGEGVSTNASVKTGFQNFVPTISTLKMRHVLEQLKLTKANNNSRNCCSEIEFIEFDTVFRS